MKPFNLAEALAGAPVTTREGYEVTHLTNFQVVGGDCLAGILEGHLETWRPDGAYVLDYASKGDTHQSDLFMTTVRQSRWVAMHLVLRCITEDVYLSEKEAEEHIKHCVSPKFWTVAKFEVEV